MVVAILACIVTCAAADVPRFWDPGLSQLLPEDREALRLSVIHPELLAARHADEYARELASGTCENDANLQLGLARRNTNLQVGLARSHEITILAIPFALILTKYFVTAFQAVGYAFCDASPPPSVDSACAARIDAVKAAVAR